MLRERVNADIDLVFAEQPPVYGAAVNCMRLFGGDFDKDSFADNFVRNLNE